MVLAWQQAYVLIIVRVGCDWLLKKKIDKNPSDLEIEIKKKDIKFTN